MVVFQFVISMVMIVSTIVVFDQIRFLGQKDIGFNRENLMVISNAEWAGVGETFANELKEIPGVEMVSYNTSVPPNLYDGDQFGAEGTDKVIPINYTKGDEEYIPTLGLKLLIGRNFSKASLADSSRVILNETAVNSLGWNMDETTLGKKIDYYGTRYEVIGIIKDFNYWSMEVPIQPMADLSFGRKKSFLCRKTFRSDSYYIDYRSAKGDCCLENQMGKVCRFLSFPLQFCR